MDKRLFGAVLLLIFLSQEIVASHVRMCKSRSHGFSGRCFIRSRNCRTICLHEGFQHGHCWQASCYCMKPCDEGSGISHGGGGGTHFGGGGSHGGGGGSHFGGGGGGSHGGDGGSGGGEGGEGGGGIGGGGGAGSGGEGGEGGGEV